MKHKRTVTPEQAAEMLHVHLATVYRLIDAGAITPAGEGFGTPVLLESVKACRLRKCGFCQQDFNAAHGRQEYCSDLCRFNAGNQRKRQRAQKATGQTATAQASQITPAKAGKRLEGVLKRVLSRRPTSGRRDISRT